MEISRDETAQRRTDHRSQLRGNGQVTDGFDQFSTRHRAENHDAPDRHHHGAAYTLQKARSDKCRQRAGCGAHQRTRQEHHDGGTEDGTRTEAIGDPAADRDEYAEPDHI